MARATTTVISIAILALGMLSPPGAQAGYVVTFQEVGSNVVETGHGWLDLTDLGRPPGSKDIADQPAVSPAFGFYVSGAAGALIDAYGVVTGPSSFGFRTSTLASSSSGDGVGLDVTDNEVFVPKGYVSGAPLQETSTYEGQSFKSLGMFSGRYVYSWGSGDHADNLAIYVGSGPIPGSIPEPSTWAMMVSGFAGLVYAKVRRNGAIRRALAWRVLKVIGFVAEVSWPGDAEVRP